MTTATLTPLAPPATPQRPANQQALEITGRAYISFSQINTMRSCPLKFQLHYIKQVRPDFTPASLAFGSAIHAAVETHLRGLLAGVTLSAGDLQQAYRLSWQQETTQLNLPVQYAKDQDAQILDDLAERMLEAYLASPVAASVGTLLGIEESFTATIDRDLPDVLAQVDMLFESADAIVVRDLKTSRSRWNEAKVLEQADQLVLYAQLLTPLARGLGKPVQAEFVVLTKARNPVLQLLPVDLAGGRMDQLRQTIATTWQAVQAGNFYPSPSPMNCSTCPYKSHCPAFSGR